MSGYYGTVGGAMSQQGAEIAICTIEKANGMVNRMLEEGRLDELGCLTIDEAHMISDEHRFDDAHNGVPCHHYSRFALGVFAVIHTTF